MAPYCAPTKTPILFVFTVVDSAMSTQMVTPEVVAPGASTLVGTAMAQALGLSATVPPPPSSNDAALHRLSPKMERW